MNESYSYAFSFTSIRIHNWEAGDGREGFGTEKWRHTPACIKNAPNKEGPPVAPLHLHHTANDLACSFPLFSVASEQFLFHFFHALSTLTYALVPSCGDCVYVSQLGGGHSSMN